MNTLKTQRLILRLLELSDVDELEKLAGDIEIARTTLGIPHPYPAGTAESFIRFRQEVASKGDGYSFAIMNETDPSLLGVIGLHINNKHNNGELSYWIGKPFWGQGYASEAANRIIQFAFDELKLNKVWAAAMTKNPASTKVMEKVGMKYEGTFREHILKWDKYENVAYYGILYSEYKITLLS